MIKVLLSPKIACLVDRKNGATGLLIFPYWSFLHLLGRHTSQLQMLHGQVWNLRLSHLVVHKTTREEGKIIKCCTAVQTDARFNGFHVAER